LSSKGGRKAAPALQATRLRRAGDLEQRKEDRWRAGFSRDRLAGTAPVTQYWENARDG